VRATVMVRNVLRRLEVREAAARLEAARASAKAAAAKAKLALNDAAKAKLALNVQDDRPSGRPARNFEAKAFTPPPGKAPSSMEKDPPRSAVRVVGAAEGKDSSRSGGPKTDGSKSDPDRLEPAKYHAAYHAAGHDTARQETAKQDVTKPDVTKPEDAKPEQKEAATPPRRPRVQRVARFSYSDMLKPH
jgi:hypothetical protein